MDVGSMRKIDQIDWFLLYSERRIQFPLLKRRRWIDRLNADRRLHLIEMEAWGLFHPLLESASKWTCLADTFHLAKNGIGSHTKDQVLHIAVIQPIGDRRRREELWISDQGVDCIPTGPTESHHSDSARVD